MTLSPKLGVVEIRTLWHFRLPLPIQMFIKVVSSPRLSGIGMSSPILWSHPLKMQRIVLRSSLLWWELGTNSLITGPGEWLSFRRFTSKLSWSWSWSQNNLSEKVTQKVFSFQFLFLTYLLNNVSTRDIISFTNAYIYCLMPVLDWSIIPFRKTCFIFTNQLQAPEQLIL